MARLVSASVAGSTADGSGDLVDFLPDGADG